MTIAPPPPSLAGLFLPDRRHMVIVAAFTLLLSWPLHRLAGAPYLNVFGHIGFIGAALLVAYSVAGRRHPAWLGRGPARLAAVLLTAPPAVLVPVLVEQRGDLLGYLNTPQALLPQVFTVVLAVFFGVPFTLLAMRAERMERERADRLEVELKNNRLERELLDVRLRMLRAQIEPHFLFNTLANVEALVASGSPNAGPVLRHLIAYLRAAMPRLDDADATLATELQLVASYLELMRLRMPDRLSFSVSAPDGAAALRFPAMALLTLAENAVRHGIDPSVDGGHIDVGGTCDQSSGAVCLWVSDTGVGMSEMAQAGTGLANLRARLEGFYGRGAQVSLHEVAPHGVRVELHIQSRENRCDK